MGTTSLNLPGGSRQATEALTRVTSGRMVMKSERQSQRDNTRGHAHQSRELPIDGLRAPRVGYEALTKFLESENRRLREARQQLEAAGARQAKLDDLAPVGLVTLGADGKILDINRIAAALVGREKPELLNRPFGSLVVAEDLPKFKVHLRRCRMGSAEMIGQWGGGAVRGRPSSVAVLGRARQSSARRASALASPKVISSELSLRGSGNGPLVVQVASVPVLDGESRLPQLETTLIDITQRKRAEAALLVSEQNLRALMEASPHPIVFKDAAGRWLLANPAALELFELTGVDYRNQRDSELAVHSPFFRAALQRREQADRAAMNAGRMRRGDEVVAKPDGSARVIDVIRAPLLYPDGRTKGLVALGYDITESKHKEQALQQAQEQLELRVCERTAELLQANAALQSEMAGRQQAELARARLAAIVESSSDAILSEDLDGKITSWNRAAERVFGYTSGQMAGRSSLALVPSDRRGEYRQTRERIRRGELVEPFETVRLRKQGGPVEVSLTVSPVMDAQGQVTGISVIHRDISRRKQAEEALRASEARLQAILDHSPAMMFLKDTQGRYLHVSRHFEQAFHLPRGRALGRSDAEIFPHDQASAFRANDQKVIESRVPIQFDEVAIHKDGPHTSLVTKFPIYDQEGKIYAVGGVVTDITERKRLEEEVLRISEREQRRIAQDLHDGLGQQLAGISCLSNTLSQKLAQQGSPEAQKAARISKLLDGAVNVTHSLAHGLHPVEAEPAGLMSALENLAASVRDLFRVSCRFKCSRPVLLAENIVATHLYRIAQEAVTNALKHGRSKRIDIVLSATPEQTMLEVRDDGVGFEKGVPPHKGLGLRTMTHRAGKIGGTLLIRKGDRGGTEVACTVPRIRRSNRANSISSGLPIGQKNRL